MHDSPSPLVVSPPSLRRHVLRNALASTEVVASACLFLLITLFIAFFGRDLGLPDWSPAIAALVGCMASGTLIGSALHDPDHVERVVRNHLEESMRIDGLSAPAVRGLAIQLIDHRARMERYRTARAVKRAQVERFLDSADRWMESLRTLIRLVEPLQREWSRSAERRSRLECRIMELETRIQQVSGTETRRQLRETMAGRRMELNALEGLEALIERAILRLEHAVSTFGALDAKMAMLHLQGEDQGDASLLAQRIEIEIADVDDVIRAMQRVEFESLEMGHGANHGPRQLENNRLAAPKSSESSSVLNAQYKMSDHMSSGESNEDPGNISQS